MIIKYLKSLFLLFSLTMFQSVLPQGKIILLNGTSSAGKSTLSKELVKLSKGEWIAIDGDYLPNEDPIIVAWRPIIINFLEEALERQLTDEERFRIINDDWHDLDEKNYGLSKDDWSTVESKDFEKVLNQHLLDMIYKKAIRLSGQGKNVIVPTVFGDYDDSDIQKELKVFKNSDNVYLVLVYCPFSVLEKRVRRRNALAHHPGATHEQKSDFRALIGVLMQLRHFYKAYRTGDVVIDEIYADDIGKSWETAKSEAIEKDWLPEEKIDQERQELFKSLGLTEGTSDPVPIAPKYHYDLVVNVGVNSLEKCAQQIYDYVTSSQKNEALEKNFQESAQDTWLKRFINWLKSFIWGR